MRSENNRNEQVEKGKKLRWRRMRGNNRNVMVVVVERNNRNVVVVGWWKEN